MKINGTPWRSIWWIDAQRGVGIVDQSALPHAFATLELSDWHAVAAAITDMKLRGAPLIGVAGAWGVVLAMPPTRRSPRPARRWPPPGPPP
jgi:methylthioribose-1-phosphate isomerase